MEIFAVSTGVDTCNSPVLGFDVLFGAFVAGDELVANGLGNVVTKLRLETVFPNLPVVLKIDLYMLHLR